MGDRAEDTILGDSEAQGGESLLDGAIVDHDHPATINPLNSGWRF